jgi:hypothetical protein
MTLTRITKYFVRTALRYCGGTATSKSQGKKWTINCLAYERTENAARKMIQAIDNQTQLDRESSERLTGQIYTGKVRSIMPKCIICRGIIFNTTSMRWLRSPERPASMSFRKTVTIAGGMREIGCLRKI